MSDKEGEIKRVLPDLSFDCSSPDGKTDTDKINILLQNIKTLRTAGEPLAGLTKLLAHMLQRFDVELPEEKDSTDDRNAHWYRMMITALNIKNEQKINVDDSVFEITTHTLPAETLADPDFQALLVTVFNRHLLTSKSRGAGNASKTRDYQSIMARVARLKHRQAHMTPFDEPLTNREKAMIAKADMLSGTKTGGYESYYQNENANCYLGLMYHTCRIVINGTRSPKGMTINNLEAVVRGIFEYAHFKCQESAAKFVAYIHESDECIVQDIDLKHGFTGLVKDDFWDDLQSNNRNLVNVKLNQRRLCRMTSVVTGKASLWGISLYYTHALLPVLKKLHEAEMVLNKSIAEEKKVLVSESIIWYLVLGKNKIINPLTDDQEQHAEGIIGSIIGRIDARRAKMRPLAKPFRSNDTHDFTRVFPSFKT